MLEAAIWTPDKHLAQYVRRTRVVQIDGCRKTIGDAAAMREKFGVDRVHSNGFNSPSMVGINSETVG
jgi:hypothetical protein